MPDRTSAAAAGRALPLRQDAIRGIALITLGYAVISVSDAAVKWALPEVGVAVAMVWRGFIGMAVIAALARGRGLWPRRVPLLALRSTLHCTVGVAFYLAWFNGVPLADTYAITAVAPLLMTAMAVPLLGERVDWRRWAGIGAGFAGVLVMLQPGGDLWRWEAGMLLGSVLVLAVTRIWTRVLAATDTPQAIAFWLLFAHVPIGLLLLPAFPPQGPLVPGTPAIVALALFGLANGCAHMLFARAFAIAPVSVLAPYEYTTLIWGGLLGFLIWADVPAWTTLGGAAVVIAAGLYNLQRERARASDRRRAEGLEAPSTGGVNRPRVGAADGADPASDRRRAEGPEAPGTGGVGRPLGPRGQT